jgi:dTDP-4-dehydrorhamnose reductase
LVSVFPEIIILAAAEANVDVYESKPEISLNQKKSAQQIVDWCEKNNCFLVFVSTDSVFDGKNAPYLESDKPNPLCEYGKNKLEIEKIIQEIPEHIIIRTSVLYGIPVTSNKFIGKAILNLSSGKKVSAATDWIRTPTLTKDFAFALIKLLELNQTGLFHVTGSSSVSMFEAALLVAEEFNASKELIESCKCADLILPAKRPLNASLNISKLNSLGIKMSSLKKGLKFVHEKMKEKEK